MRCRVRTEESTVRIDCSFRYLCNVDIRGSIVFNIAIALASRKRYRNQRVMGNCLLIPRPERRLFLRVANVNRPALRSRCESLASVSCGSSEGALACVSRKLDANQDWTPQQD